MYLRAGLCNLLFVVATLLVGLGFLPVTLLGRRRGVIRLVARSWARLLLYTARWVCGVRWEVTGREHVPKEGAFLVAAKHQSAWETLAFHLYLDAPVFVLKQELLMVPVVGMYLRWAKSIVIDRKGGAAQLKTMVEETKARLADGHAVIIFPEGTRIAPGETGKYHAGVAALYAKCDVPLVPVAVNSGLCWGKNAFVKRPGLITMAFLPPIAPGALRRDQVVGELQGVIEPATRELEASAIKNCTSHKTEV